MVLLLKLMQQCVLWEHLVSIYNCYIFPIYELISFRKNVDCNCFLLNIEVNNLRKSPVLQLKESNSHLRLYLLNEQIMRGKHVLRQTCHGLDN